MEMVLFQCLSYSVMSVMISAMETICIMSNLFSGKNITNLSSAELGKRVVKVKQHKTPTVRF